MAWTLTLGILSWVAFLYIGLRTRRVRWILWGLVYFATFMGILLTTQYQETQLAFTGLMVVAGMVSIVHAFMVRNDYLVRLENRMQAAAEDDTRASRRPEAERRPRAAKPLPVERSEQPAPGGSSATETVMEEPGVPEALTVPPVAMPNRTPVGINTGSNSEAEEPLESNSIRDSYPLPIAYGWSLLESFWDPRDRYREQLRQAENMLAYLGSVSLALLEEQDYERAKIDLKLPWQGGISFGGWRLIIVRSAEVFRSYRNHPLGSAIGRLNIDSEEEGFGADVATLISARNNFHHGRGPLTEEEIASASDEAQQQLRRCMERLSFLAQYPIRLVQDFDVNRRGGEFLLKCLRLMGDGPGFTQEKVIFPKALPRGDLFLDLGNQNWTPLFPYVVASNCPYCRYRETYFIDRWNRREGTVLMKSFERGHTEERRDVSAFLVALTGKNLGLRVHCKTSR